MVKDIVLISIDIAITALFCARLWYFLKVKKDDPLKAVIPWFEKLKEDAEINEAFSNRG